MNKKKTKATAMYAAQVSSTQTENARDTVIY